MKNINKNVFLNKISEKIKQGEFDIYLTIPFMSRDLLFYSIKGRIDKKIDTGGTPILSDAEIKDCISEAKETATNIIACYIKNGFMKRTEEGLEFTEKGYLAIKSAYHG